MQIEQSAVPAATGDVLFARYAFPPNELGYCGPDDPDVLLRHATTSVEPVDEIARRARLFDGAWVYLEQIAAAAGIADPMDARVVEAYWIGNDLLDIVDPQAFRSTLRHRFAGQIVGPTATRWDARPESETLAHHSFHVFAVYPWVGLLSARSDIALSVLDSCRIRWGTVTDVDGDHVRVRSQPLTWDGHRLDLGAERIESVRWSTGGAGSDASAGSPMPGDVVACHWDWVCDRLTDAQVDQLTARSADQLAAVNALSP